MVFGDGSEEEEDKAEEMEGWVPCKKIAARLQQQDCNSKIAVVARTSEKWKQADSTNTSSHTPTTAPPSTSQLSPSAFLSFTALFNFRQESFL